MDPQAPSNEGWFRPVSLVCPPGTVFTAEKPAPTGWYYEGSAHASELAWKALAEVAPERFGAGSYMSLSASYFYGRDPESGEVYVHIEPAIGGWGATATARRHQRAHRHHRRRHLQLFGRAVSRRSSRSPSAATRSTPRAAPAPGASGAASALCASSRWAGADAHTYCSIGRSIERPWGLEGGGEGSNNYMRIESGGSVERVARIP